MPRPMENPLDCLRSGSRYLDLGRTVSLGSPLYIDEPGAQFLLGGCRVLDGLLGFMLASQKLQVSEQRLLCLHAGFN